MEEILKMIESVDPSDTAKLDEIDARVWCFSQNEEYAGKTGLLTNLMAQTQLTRN